MADGNYRPLNSCVHCSASFAIAVKLDGQPKVKQPQWCSKDCYQRQRHSSHRGFDPATVRHCVLCAAEYETKHKSSMYCSKVCKVTAFKRKDDPLFGTRRALAADRRAQQEAAREQRRAIARADAWWRREVHLLRLLNRRCPVCDAKLNRDGRAQHCSKACASVAAKAVKGAARAMRKARLKTQTVECVNPRKVFQRDGWRCYLCGCETPPSARGTYLPNAPEVEHVVPVTRGGSHAYANVRCACRTCNAIKANHTLEEIGGALLP